MSYGLEVLGPSGARQVSPTKVGLLFRSYVQIPSGSGTWTWTFPELTGRTCSALIFDGAFLDYIVPTWTYPSGIPTLKVKRDVLYVGGGRATAAFIYVQ